MPNSDSLTIDHHSNQPVARPLEIGYCRVLELSVTVRTEDQQVTWVMADFWVKMMDLKVRVAVPFLERERAKLTPPFMRFSKQNANSGGCTLVALSNTWKYSWSRLAWRLISNAQQLFLAQLSRALPGQPRKRT